MEVWDRWTVSFGLGSKWGPDHDLIIRFRGVAGVIHWGGVLEALITSIIQFFLFVLHVDHS